MPAKGGGEEARGQSRAGDAGAEGRFLRERRAVPLPTSEAGPARADRTPQRRGKEDTRQNERYAACPFLKQFPPRALL